MTASDRAFGALHRSGWTFGDTAFAKPPGIAWRVHGTQGDHTIAAEGRTRDEAWKAAVAQAAALGMLSD